MTYTKEFNVCEFPFWSGAKDTVDDIRKAGKIDALGTLIEEMFCADSPTATQINDFVWFERDIIFENLGITEDEIVE